MVTFASWAKNFERPLVRRPLIVVGILVTPLLLSRSLSWALVWPASLMSDVKAEDESSLLVALGWTVLGTGGVIGIVGGWARILISVSQTAARPFLRHTIEAALAIGVLVAAAVGFFLLISGLIDDNDPIAPFKIYFGCVGLLAMGCGIFMLGATVSDRAIAP